MAERSSVGGEGGEGEGGRGGGGRGERGGRRGGRTFILKSICIHPKALIIENRYKCSITYWHMSRAHTL